jgi:hypothetical protein
VLSMRKNCQTSLRSAWRNLDFPDINLFAMLWLDKIITKEWIILAVVYGTGITCLAPMDVPERLVRETWDIRLLLRPYCTLCRASSREYRRKLGPLTVGPLTVGPVTPSLPSLWTVDNFLLLGDMALTHQFLSGIESIFVLFILGL